METLGLKEQEQNGSATVQKDFGCSKLGKLKRPTLTPNARMEVFTTRDTIFAIAPMDSKDCIANLKPNSPLILHRRTRKRKKCALISSHRHCRTEWYNTTTLKYNTTLFYMKIIIFHHNFRIWNT